MGPFLPLPNCQSNVLFPGMISKCTSFRMECTQEWMECTPEWMGWSGIDSTRFPIVRWFVSPSIKSPDEDLPSAGFLAIHSLVVKLAEFLFLFAPEQWRKGRASCVHALCVRAIQWYKCTNTQTYNDTKIQWYKYTIIQRYKYTMIQRYNNTNIH